MTLTPTIDYSNKDFASLRQAMLDLARYRLPEWTDQSPGDLGMLLVDLFAYMGDIILYYQDRIANESFLATATDRRSVLHLLRLIGYELKPPVAAAADLTLIFKPVPSGASSVVTIPEGAQFATKANGGNSLTFEYHGPDLTINLHSAQVTTRGDGKYVYTGLPVRHSRSISIEVIGSSTGEPNQMFSLSQSPLIPESLLVEVNEGAAWVEWEQRDSLLYYIGPDGRVTLSGPSSRDYYVQYDENDGAQIIFGDGVYGRKPPVGTNNIHATYWVGGGTVGNVPAGAISEPKTNISLLDSVTNAAPAAGGADHESIDQGLRFGPLAFRSGQRAVTLNDYVTLAFQAGGLAKVRARSENWNQVDLYIAPEGDTCRPVPKDLKSRIIAFFEDRRMMGTFVQVLDPTYVPIDIALDIVYDHHFRADMVRQAVENAVGDLLAFRNVDFGQSLYLSDLYARIEATPGVFAVNVTRFRRSQSDNVAIDIEAELQRLNLPNLNQLPEFLQQAILSLDVPSGGRIDIEEFQIPFLNKLEVKLKEGTR